MVVLTESEQEQNSEVHTVLKSLDNPETAGLILEEQANALKSILGDASVLKLIRAHDKLEEGRKQVETQDTVKLAREVLTELEPQVASEDGAAELSGLIQDPHFMALLETHDAVAFRTYAAPPDSPGLDNEPEPINGFGGQPIRMVGLHKQANKPLGMTLAVEKGDLVVARIIHGGMIDKQGLLHVGDKIKEVNGRDMSGNPKELQDYLRDCTGKIFLKVVPSNLEAPAIIQIFLRAHFDYNPEKDTMIPCQDAGLAFKKGDVLQIVEQDDPNWWQAKKTDGSNEAGIIPSQICEERRRSFVKKERPTSGFLCGGKKKQKVMYQSAKNADYDRHEMTIYEEVAKMPPFQRKTLVLIGAQGVGRRTLKNKLILSDRERFGTTIPHTSREPREGEESGKGYHFSSRAEMEQDIRAGKYLEHGDYEASLYGTKVDSIRDVMRSGKMCLLDVNPTALKILKTPEFMPYVVFIASPPLDDLREIHKRATSEGTITKKQTDEDLQKTVEESEKLYSNYSHYFDDVVVNEDLNEALDRLKKSIDNLRIDSQWVPVSWVY